MASSVLTFNVARRVFNKFKGNEIPASTIHSNFDIEFSEEKEPEDYLGNIKKRYTKRSSSSHAIPKGDSKKDDKLERIRQFPPPKFEIFPSCDLTYHWEVCRNIGPGLNNAGNTCFLNSVLQILSFTPPLWQYLISADLNNCKQNGFCSFCALSKVFRSMNTNSNKPVFPSDIIYNIKHICFRMRNGRQEDAHEFLVSLMDSLKKHFSTDVKQLDRFSLETHMIDHIFGGWTRGTVTCLECHHESTTFDPLLDINLDIDNCSNVETSIFHYFATQHISGSTYYCAECKKRVAAKKKVDIEKCPKFLIIQLKRFRFDGQSYSKNSKHIKFEEQLDITPYVLNGNEGQYSLYGVIVHQGSSCNSGHYYAYAKSQHGIWSQLNDSTVLATGTKRLLSENAYLLFFKKNEVLSNDACSFHESSNHNNYDSNDEYRKHHCRSKSLSHVQENDSLSKSSSTFDINHKKIDNFHPMDVPIARWNQKNNVPVLSRSFSSVFQSNPSPSITSWDGGSNHIDDAVHPPMKKNSYMVDEELEHNRKRKHKPNTTQHNIYRPNPFDTAHKNRFHSKKNKNCVPS